MKPINSVDLLYSGDIAFVGVIEPKPRYSAISVILALSGLIKVACSCVSYISFSSFASLLRCFVPSSGGDQRPVSPSPSNHGQYNDTNNLLPTSSFRSNDLPLVPGVEPLLKDENQRKLFATICAVAQAVIFMFYCVAVSELDQTFFCTKRLIFTRCMR